MLIAPPTVLINLFEPWNKFYSDSKLSETLLMFVHTAGLVVAGGIAIATDRATLRAAAWTDVDRRHHLAEMTVLHRTVIAGLAFTILSGLAMFTADIETFWASWIFWVKMITIALLLANGALMGRVEERLHQDSSADSANWGRLRTRAIVSLTLWLTVALGGVALQNYA